MARKTAKSSSRNLRPTLLDAIEIADRKNIFCSLDDLGNEASVEAYFAGRLLGKNGLGFSDDQIRQKESVESFKVSMGRRKVDYRPDYIIFLDGQPRCVIDAKATDVPLEQWVGQCGSYCHALNRQVEGANPVGFFLLTNGIATSLYKWDDEKPVLTLGFADFKAGNAQFDRLRELMSPASLCKETASVEPQRNDFEFSRPTAERAKYIFAQCHDAIRDGDGGGVPFAFMEFVKLMFLKLYYDKRLHDNEPTRAYFQSDQPLIKIPSGNVTFSVSWINFQESQGYNNPVDSILFTQLRNEIEKNVALQRKKRLFDTDEQIRLKPETIKEVVGRLEHFDMFGIDEDLNGRLFETFLSATMRGRSLGQFFTPRSIVKLMTYITAPRANRDRREKVLDGCCGSGGFLIEALTVMRTQLRDAKGIPESQKKLFLEEVCNDSIYGMDLGKEPLLARIARINMYLHGDGGSRIYHADGVDKELDTSHESDPETIKNLVELKRDMHDEMFDVVLTNPPFSMGKNTKKPSGRRILGQYQIARASKDSIRVRTSVRTSVLFFERYRDLLKPGGRLAMVIDDTLLSSKDFGYVRDYIREHFLIRAIISIPGNAFRRSGSRVKTSVLVLEKKSDPNDQQTSWYGYFSETLGIDDLTPRATEAEVAEARGRSSAEIARIVAGYNGFIKDEATANVYAAELISDRLDLKNCVNERGRMVADWKALGYEVKTLGECVKLVENVVKPGEQPDEKYKLIKVSYAGKCLLDKTRRGDLIKSKTMYRADAGQIVFSIIRSTDGAIGIVPGELDGAVVSTTSFVVLEAESKEDAAYLWAVLRSHELRADMQSLSPGSGRYTTHWEDVQYIQVPWMDADARHQIGSGIIAAWAKEKEALSDRREAMSPLDALKIESDESKRRFKASQAPS